MREAQNGNKTQLEILKNYKILNKQSEYEENK